MQPILKVNLSTQAIELYTIPADWEQQFLGGASLAARMLYDSLTPDLDPLSPEAPLLFLNGPLSGTFGPAVGRFVVCGRSPATGLWGEANCGGFWGPELRKTGFDGLWVTGRASEPVFLWIHDRDANEKQVEIRPAAHLMGQDTYQIQTAIESELKTGKVRVASIGVAGENCLPFALILCDHGRVAGRTGMGAVMGAKNLKAIAVQGHGQIPVARPQIYQPVRSEANRHLRADSMTQVLRELGTSGAADYFNYLGEMPKRYFSLEKFPEDLQVSGAGLKDTILTGVSACHACVIACGRVVTLEDGERRKGPEYETLVGFGPNLMLNDPVVVTRAGELCDRYGMDTISLSNTIGLAYRLYELGLITEMDTGGFKLEWGNPAPLEDLITLAAHQEGFGAFLAEGARELGKRYGAEAEAVHVNGLEVAYHDPRGSSGMALVYATSPRGACHNQSDYFLVDVGQVEPSLGMQYYHRLGNEEKAGNVAIHQNWRTLFNSLVLCLFSNLDPETVLKLINGACDVDWSMVDMLQAGERGWNIKRVINNRLGLTRANDKLPKPLMIPFADSAGQPESPMLDLESMLDAYYRARCWDQDTGYPTPEKLSELGLEFVVNDLWAL
jgi:aldehyde:ferredoxin oxidoreductase